jgi:hypothetical protein
LGALERKAGKIEVISWLSAGGIYSNVFHVVFWLYRSVADNIFVNIRNPYQNITDSLWGTLKRVLCVTVKVC